MNITTEAELARLCVSLMDAGALKELSPSERLIANAAPPAAFGAEHVEAVRHVIEKGDDPLGECFTTIRNAALRRATGAVYTPATIVRSMTDWLVKHSSPDRVIDPGAGSGRFLVEAAQHLDRAHLVAVELDPLAALTARANLNVRNLTGRSTVLVQDYHETKLPRIKGQTAFLGNPPYVRHHEIGERWKRWYSDTFKRMGIKASALAGLHLHFFLQTHLLAKAGDVGAFVTSAEWLDVNYGAALRSLLTDELGGIGLHVLDPKIEAFPGTATTAAITCFRAGERQAPVVVRAVESQSSLSSLAAGIDVPREVLRSARRWSIIVRPPSSTAFEGQMELGELFRVHRGQVTGANGIWIAGEHATHLPARVMIPSVTKAKDLIQAGAQLRTADALRRVIDLPTDLDEFTQDERHSINRFLQWARNQGADQSYIAQHRKAWWSVGLKAPAPILCTYMARRAPQFTLNACQARHINVAHGLYPREALSNEVINGLVEWLNSNIETHSGRTYAGGLTKFEPKEIERLRIPRLEALTG